MRPLLTLKSLKRDSTDNTHLTPQRRLIPLKTGPTVIDKSRSIKLLASALLSNQSPRRGLSKDHMDSSGIKDTPGYVRGQARSNVRRIFVYTNPVNEHQRKQNENFISAFGVGSLASKSNIRTRAERTTFTYLRLP